MQNGTKRDVNRYIKGLVLSAVPTSFILYSPLSVWRNYFDYCLDFFFSLIFSCYATNAFFFFFKKSFKLNTLINALPSFQCCDLACSIEKLNSWAQSALLVVFITSVVLSFWLEWTTGTEWTVYGWCELQQRHVFVQNLLLPVPVYAHVHKPSISAKWCRFTCLEAGRLER